MVKGSVPEADDEEDNIRLTNKHGHFQRQPIVGDEPDQHRVLHDPIEQQDEVVVSKMVQHEAEFGGDEGARRAAEAHTRRGWS